MITQIKRFNYKLEIINNLKNMKFQSFFKKIYQLVFPIVLLGCLLFIGCTPKVDSKNYDADVIIYGGTSAAVTTAVQLKRMGKTVLIVCPEKHIGGLSSSGLGFTDLGNKTVIGGISKEFYQSVYNHYQNQKAWNWQPRNEYGNEGQGTTAIDESTKTMWTFEPHVAEKIFEDMVKKYNIKSCEING